MPLKPESLIRMSRHQLSLTLRVAVFGLLIGSAVLACLAGERIFYAWQARSAHGAGQGPVLGIFVAFMVALSLDRWWAVRRRAYPASRALLQVAFAAALLMMLMPARLPSSTLAVSVVNFAGDPLDEDAPAFLLSHPEAEVRGAACAMLRDSQPVFVLDKVEELSEDDPDIRVREVCAHALGLLWAGDAQMNTNADAPGP